jgi:galactitol-specific phosphotransferase system IIC component
MNDKPGWWEKIEWRGAIAFTLAIGVAGSMILAIVGAIIAIVVRTVPLGDQAANMLSTLFGAALGALATYLGQGKNGKSET